MATYTYTQLYGTGSAGENISSGVTKTFTFSNPSSSAYFIMETVRNGDGFYNSGSSNNFSGSLFASSSMGLVTSPYSVGIVVQPGVNKMRFTPSLNVTGTNYRLRGTGMYSLVIS
jgi:hypothetical protein